MTQLLRIKLNWTGFVGGPGYTNLHFGLESGADGAWITPENIAQAVTKVDLFLASLIPRIPPIVTVNMDKTAEVIAIADGRLIDFKTITTTTRTGGTGTGSYSAASGAVINWYSSGVRRGRRVRGRTFLVPLAGSALATDGTLDTSALGAFNTMATDLAAPTASGARLMVWGRPTPVLDDAGKATGETTPDGVAYPVVSSRVADKVAILRSRRD